MRDPTDHIRKVPIGATEMIRTVRKEKLHSLVITFTNKELEIKVIGSPEQQRRLLQERKMRGAQSKDICDCKGAVEGTSIPLHRYQSRYSRLTTSLILVTFSAGYGLPYPYFRHNRSQYNLSNRIID
jgi:hypothetical protein